MLFESEHKNIIIEICLIILFSFFIFRHLRKQSNIIKKLKLKIKELEAGSIINQIPGMGGGGMDMGRGGMDMGRGGMNMGGGGMGMGGPVGMDMGDPVGMAMPVGMGGGGIGIVGIGVQKNVQTNQVEVLPAEETFPEVIDAKISNELNELTKEEEDVEKEEEKEEEQDEDDISDGESSEDDDTIEIDTEKVTEKFKEMAEAKKDK